MCWVTVNQQKALGSIPAVPLKISPRFSKDAAFSSCKSRTGSLGTEHDVGQITGLRYLQAGKSINVR